MLYGNLGELNLYVCVQIAGLQKSYDLCQDGRYDPELLHIFDTACKEVNRLLMFKNSLKAEHAYLQGRLQSVKDHPRYTETEEKHIRKGVDDDIRRIREVNEDEDNITLESDVPLSRLFIKNACKGDVGRCNNAVPQAKKGTAPLKPTDGGVKESLRMEIETGQDGAVKPKSKVTWNIPLVNANVAQDAAVRRDRRVTWNIEPADRKEMGTTAARNFKNVGAYTEKTTPGSNVFGVERSSTAHMGKGSTHDP